MVLCLVSCKSMDQLTEGGWDEGRSYVRLFVIFL